MNHIRAVFCVASIIQLVQGTTVERKIIVSDKVPAPLAFYSQAVQVNNVLYISGNLGMTVDGDLVEGVTNQTKLALDNIGHVLEAAGITFDNVVKVTVMLSDIQDYGAMNDVYGLYFKDKAPARSAFSATLPREAKVEIDAVAMIGAIIDVQEQRNNAPRIKGTLPMLLVLLVQCTVFYQMVFR
ncbi:2-iminobutanoate/2-iminopropanoate deaminase-like [Bradysia coprophila]|uniref:2-iminobutanoate/2-iminopropanoate deaminase-like n=1 Tax=Bradysia coprophila TaxID=38358 RepID=UPI00187D988B|nr:2-iminobutanoate/2-iminopropanoate deaminase-like [Bradysia coprophila]